MKRSLFLVIALLLVALLGCEQSAPPTPQVVTNPTALALLPTEAPTAAATSTTAPQTETPRSSPDAAAPTPTGGSDVSTSPTAVIGAPGVGTPAAAPQGMSYCGEPIGERLGERFSAELQAVAVEATASVERVTLTFEPGEGQIHGSISCLLPEAAALPAGEDQAALLRLELPNWEHDERFAASAAVLDGEVAIEDTSVIRSAALSADADASAGLVLELGLAEPVPFSARVEENSIVIEVALAPAAPYGNDPLTEEQNAPVTPDTPIYYLQGGDIWRLQGGEAAPLLQTPELETALAVSPDGNGLAFCRASSLDAADLGTLWLSDSDGAEPRRLADIGGCADPVFAPDGEQVYFVAPLSPTPPLVFQLWSVELGNGSVTQLSGLDEWSRRHPQPLENGSIVSLGLAGPDRSVLLLDRPGEQATELSGELLGLGAHTDIAEAMVAPDGRSVAVVARRSGGGADLALLGINGKLQSTISEGYWNRPLAWSSDGTLYYLRAVCASGLLLNYEIRALSGAEDRLLLAGAMSDDIGAATATESGLAVVRQPTTLLVPRGPQPAPAGPASIWQIGGDGGRIMLHQAEEPIGALAP